jgi:Ulp1 family protease
VIDFVQKEIRYFDPFGYSADQSLLQPILEWLLHVAPTSDAHAAALTFLDKCEITSNNNKVQKNGKDCGMFVLVYLFFEIIGYPGCELNETRVPSASLLVVILNCYGLTS